MNHTSPIALTASKTEKGTVINLLHTASDWNSVNLPDAVKKRYAARSNEESLVVHVPGETDQIVILPKEEEEASYKLQQWRVLGANVRTILNREGVECATLKNHGVPKDEVLALAEGIALASYQFLTYKTGKHKKVNSLKELRLLGDEVSQADLDELSGVLQGTFAARDFVNEPVVTLTASEWSRRITELGNEAGFTTKVLDKKAIEKLKMGGLLGVNKGSTEPPTFNVLEWKPKNAKNTRPLVLVGKGVVYDTGGYSIKAVKMANMKCDMGGGAAVSGAMATIALNKLPVHVIGLIPATDNRINSEALVPDDVITMMSGTTVEVLNTDAEGRLILADALHYAKQYDPELVIDLATLTGSAARITGHHGVSMCADKAPQKDVLKTSGEKVYERVMEFPMWREYHEAIRSNVADIKNLGGPEGGNITAATFLHHFTDYPWIHLDIAGPAYLEKDVDYRLKGGTGVGVRLLYDFIKSYVD